MTNKIIVGILPQTKMKSTNDPYKDKYEFLEVYTKKIFEVGAIPIGLIAEDGRIKKEILDICDAFLIQGGNKVEGYHFEVIGYAIKENKPLLGICLGMQALGIFSDVLEVLENKKEEKYFFETYKNLKENNNGSLLSKIESPNIHGDYIINYDDSDNARHIINIIDKNSHIYNIYNKDSINVVSLHSSSLKYVGKDFKITSYSEDNIIESIEYKDLNYFIIGVQWHPEWDSDNLIFKRLIEESNNRKKYKED